MIVNQMEKQRIQYIDALRGFAILLVVIHHVSLYSFNAHPAFSINSVFLTFRMPLFFFLSGFLFYKPDRFAGEGSYSHFLLNKFKVQIIPTIIFGALFAMMMNYSGPDMLFHQTKHGYWFTFVLFVYFFIFTLTSYICRKAGIVNNDAVLLVVSVIALVVCIPSHLADLFNYHPANKYLDWLSSLLSFNKWRYYVYFVFGAIVRKSGFQIQRLNCSMAITLVIVFETIFLILRHCFGPTSSYCLYGLVDFVLGFLGIIIIVTLFSKHESAVSKGNACGRFLQYIGVRTLDIYLLHYFFVPRNLLQVGEWLEKYNNPIVELSLELAVAMVAVLFCVIASNILRCSDRLAKFLFGKIIQ